MKSVGIAVVASAAKFVGSLVGRVTMHCGLPKMPRNGSVSGLASNAASWVASMANSPRTTPSVSGTDPGSTPRLDAVVPPRPQV